MSPQKAREEDSHVVVSPKDALLTLMILLCISWVLGYVSQIVINTLHYLWYIVGGGRFTRVTITCLSQVKPNWTFWDQNFQCLYTVVNSAILKWAINGKQPPGSIISIRRHILPILASVVIYSDDLSMIACCVRATIIVIGLALAFRFHYDEAKRIVARWDAFEDTQTTGQTVPIRSRT